MKVFDAKSPDSILLYSIIVSHSVHGHGHAHGHAHAHAHAHAHDSAYTGIEYDLFDLTRLDS